MRALLLVNTGSPATPKPKDVRAFIEAMLSDPLVMTVPNWIRPLLVKGIIGPFRQFASAKKYQLIWDDNSVESPLIRSANKLSARLEKRLETPVASGMVYLNPSISDGFKCLIEKEPNIEEVIVLPLFPHYAESSYLAAVQTVQREYHKHGFTFSLRIIEPYFAHPAYISAIVKSIESFWKGGEYERIIFNFHSLPIKHVEKGFELGKEYDYVYQLKETVRLVAHELDLPDKKVRVSYSSAFGEDWLKPSLNYLLSTAAKSGIKRVLVVSPGFAADNLETLYDIDIDARKTFLSYGGEELTYVPCLNDGEPWVDAIQQIVI